MPHFFFCITKQVAPLCLFLLKQQTEVSESFTSPRITLLCWIFTSTGGVNHQVSLVSCPKPHSHHLAKPCREVRLMCWVSKGGWGDFKVKIIYTFGLIFSHSSDVFPGATLYRLEYSALMSLIHQLDCHLFVCQVTHFLCFSPSG